MFNLASIVLENIMPTYAKDTSDSPSRQLKSLINYVSTHFESLEKETKIKVSNEFNDNKFSELKKMIDHDRCLLDSWIKRTQSALCEGGNVYKSCLSYSIIFAILKNRLRKMKSN